MKLVVLLSLLLNGLIVLAEINTGCPKLPVRPCTCTHSPQPYLTCDKIVDADVLRKVFLNSARARYNVVRLANSVLQYLPSDLFNNVEVKELQLDNSTFVQLFDETPKHTELLRTVHIENTFIFRGILWEHLKPMTSLEILNIYMNRIDVLGNDFVQYTPKTLTQLSLYDTKTSEIQPGVFGNFPKLDKIAVDHCSLGELNRNMFPVPFNGRFLYFNENHLVTLPADLFTDMPNLQTIGLRGNRIATLPPSIFGTIFKNLQYLMLEENPLYCDCTWKSLLENKPVVLSGTCFSPYREHGKKMDEIDPSELRCYD